MLLRLLSIVVAASLLVGCAAPTSLPGASPSPQSRSSSPTPPTVPSTPTLTPSLLPSSTEPAPSATPSPLPTGTPPPVASGPEEYPAGINPLTGLPVADPETLRLPPALISITNSPVTARPQMGLSWADWVFELWIGEGVTRFLSVFYGDLPNQGLNGEEPAIGPIRSGRLAYEPLRELFRGFLLFAYASSWVLPELDYYTPVMNEDLLKDINGAHVHVSQVRQLAAEYRQQLGEPHLSGLRFDPVPPPGGKPAQRVFMPWSWLSQVWWRYDPARGAYQRWQDREDGKTFVQASDRLTGQPLAFENLVVLFADHTAYRPELIDVNFLYIKKLPALVLRDGQLYPVFWTTASEKYERTTGRFRPIRFIDAQGNPFPLKPGRTWVAVMSTGSAYYESVDSQDYTWLATKTAPGSGIWVVRYAVPEPVGMQAFFTPTPTKVKK